MRYDGRNLNEVLFEHGKWEQDEQHRYGSRADFSDTYLYHANFAYCNLRNANFRGSNLFGAIFYGADLYRADFTGANLSYTDLSDANLALATVDGANLRGAYWTDTKVIPLNLSKAHNVDIPMICPESGSFVGWKKCKRLVLNERETIGEVIVKLLIPESAARSSSTGRKCRSSAAIVLEIQDMDGKPLDGAVAYSIYDPHFTYKAGETVMPYERFDEDRFKECASGIHFFISRQEAVRYNMA